MHTQMQLPMLTVYEGPRLLQPQIVQACKTYRDAVKACWTNRLRTRLTKAQIAEETGCYPSHVTDYLSDKETSRNLPAERIAAFEVSCGNRVITQWLAAQAHVTILESFIQARTA
jgi:hypothetical protein